MITRARAPKWILLPAVAATMAAFTSLLTSCRVVDVLATEVPTALQQPHGAVSQPAASAPAVLPPAGGFVGASPTPRSQVTETLGWAIDGDVPTAWYERLWPDGYRITGLTYGDGLWGSAVSRETGREDQKVLVTLALTGQDLDRALEDGWRVTSLAYGNAKWAFVLTKTSTIESQRMIISDSFNESELEAMRGQGFWLTSLGYGGDLWVRVYSATSGITRQQMLQTQDFPFDDIEEASRRDLFLTTEVFADGNWTIILSQSDLQAQEIAYFRGFAKDIIKVLYEKNYVRLRLLFGEGQWFVLGQK